MSETGVRLAKAVGMLCVCGRWGSTRRSLFPGVVSPPEWKSLRFKRKSLAGKYRHEWKRGFLAGAGFPTFLRRANPPPRLEDRLGRLSGEGEVLIPARVQAGIPKPRA